MIDTHCHLNDKAYKNDYEEIIQGLEQNGISKAVCVGCDVESSVFAAQLASRYNALFFSPGIHPHDAKNAGTDALMTLEGLLHEDKCVALGETGLDYYYDYSPREVQKQVFEQQLHMADCAGLPVIIHLRDAWQDGIQILKSNRDLLKKSGIVHCYSGSYESAKIFLDLGLYIAFGGAITFKNNTTSADIIRRLPRERILTETDCPYLAPQSMRGKRNEPKLMADVVAHIANILGMTFASVDELTTANAQRLLWGGK